MKIELSSTAQLHLSQLDAYLSERKLAGAERVVDRIYDSIELLARFPLTGCPGRVAGTRELVFPTTNYIVAYRLVGETIQILAVMQGAQRWPQRFTR